MASIDLTQLAFSSKQACELTGVSARQIVHWDEQGLVKPSLRPAAGRGTRRLYSYRDLLAIKVVKDLRDQGISLQRIRRCIAYLRRHLPDVSQPLNYCTLVSVGEELYLARDSRTLMATIERPGQLASRVLLRVGTLDSELRDKVIRLASKHVEDVIVGDYAYQAEIEPDEESGGFVGQVPGLPGCITQGESLDEIRTMLKDAVRTYLEAVQDLKNRGVALPVRRVPAKRQRHA
jgi:DNA-binding transcriptional MerR regulator